MSPDAVAARQVLPLFADQHPFREAAQSANHTALRTLLSAASACEVIEELEILIQYQAARRVITDQLSTQLIDQIRLSARMDARRPMRHIVAFLGQVVRMHRVIEMKGKR